MEKENVLVFIRGVKGRGEEVIKTLENMGGINVMNAKGDNDNLFYSMDMVGRIYCTEKLSAFTLFYYTEKFLPPKKYVPNDKELVWAWDDKQPFTRSLRFFDEHNTCCYSNYGRRIGPYYDNYAPYKGEYPKWAKKAQKELEE